MATIYVNQTTSNNLALKTGDRMYVWSGGTANRTTFNCWNDFDDDEDDIEEPTRLDTSNNEDSSKKNGPIVYDIRFNVVVPDSPILF